MLWRAGVRGGALTVVSAWKDGLLLSWHSPLVVVARRALPFSRSSVTDLARARVRRVRRSLRACLPQSWLGAARRTRGALRRSTRPAAGRRVLPRSRAGADERGARTALPRRARGAAGVAVVGLLDVYRCRSRSGVMRPAGSAPARARLAPGSRACRRTSSTTPATASSSGGSRRRSSRRSRLSYLLVVAIFFIPLRRRWGPRSARSSSPRSSGRTRARRVLALAAGLLVLGGRRRRPLLARLGGAVVVARRSGS